MVIFDVAALLLVLAFLAIFTWGMWGLSSFGGSFFSRRRRRRSTESRAKFQAEAITSRWHEKIAEGGGYGPMSPREGYVVYVPCKRVDATGAITFGTEKFCWSNSYWRVAGVNEHASPLTERLEQSTPLALLSEHWCDFCFKVAETLNKPLYDAYATSVLSERNRTESRQQVEQALEALPSASAVTSGLASSELPRV